MWIIHFKTYWDPSGSIQYQDLVLNILWKEVNSLILDKLHLGVNISFFIEAFGCVGVCFLSLAFSQWSLGRGGATIGVTRQSLRAQNFEGAWYWPHRIQFYTNYRTAWQRYLFEYLFIYFTHYWCTVLFSALRPAGGHFPISEAIFSPCTVCLAFIFTDKFAATRP